MDLLSVILGLIIGCILGSIAVAAIFINKRSRTLAELESQRTRAAIADEQRQQQLAEIQQLRARVDEESQLRQAAQEKVAVQQRELETLQQAEQRLKESFKAVGVDALKSNTEQFLSLAQQTFAKLLTNSQGDLEKRQQAIDNLVKPIRELLEKQNTAVGEIEKKRETAYTGLEQQIKFIAESHKELHTQTSRLVTALRRPEQRGRWGEMQLRNAVELAGMTAHCDFFEQPQTDDPETRDRPDMIIRLPGEGRIIVDSKVALDAYLDALQPDADRAALMKRHLEQINVHCKRLASKRYWDQFDRCPKLVVLFMPLESALSAALEIKPDMHAEAMQQHVMIATPTLLVALLRAIAYGWQQESLAENAREIAKVGGELYDRIKTFAENYADVGRKLTSATQSYNKSIGSFESRMLPSTRKLKELHVTTEAEIEAPTPIEIETRPITAPELLPIFDGDND